MFSRLDDLREYSKELERKALSKWASQAGRPSPDVDAEGYTKLDESYWKAQEEVYRISAEIRKLQGD